MGAIKKILSPVDFSETSAIAANKAKELARRTGAEVTLVHVLHEPAFSMAEGAGYAPPSIVDEYEATMKRKVRELAESLGQDGVAIRGKVVRGTPHEAIASVAEQDHVDLIVMGTHGRTGLSHLLLGSVAERVVRTARVPVMTVRTPS